MSGTSISIVVDAGQVQTGLKEMEARIDDLGPVLREFGEYLLRRTDDCFRAEADPEGKPWQPLSPATLVMKKNTKILTESGALRGHIAYNVQGNTLTVGTGPAQSAYAAIHQFGGKAGRGRKVTIPARPYLDITDADLVEVREMILEHVVGGGRG